MSNYQKGAMLAIGLAITVFVFALLVMSGSKLLFGLAAFVLLLAGGATKRIYEAKAFEQEMDDLQNIENNNNEDGKITWEEAIAHAVEATKAQEAQNWQALVNDWERYANELKAQLDQAQNNFLSDVEEQKQGWYEEGVSDGKAEVRDMLQAVSSQNQELEEKLKEAQSFALQVPILRRDNDWLREQNQKKPNWKECKPLLELLPKKVVIKSVRDAIRNAGFTLPNAEYKTFSAFIRNRPSVSNEKAPAQKAGEKQADGRTDARTHGQNSDGRADEEA